MCEARMAHRLLIAALALLALLPRAARAADTSILVPTGQRIDAWDVSGGGTTVLRQRFTPCGQGAAECADVKNANPAADAYGLVTRPALTDTVGATVVVDTLNEVAF